MKSWKKLISLALAGALGLSLLAACGDGSTTPANNDPAPGASTPAGDSAGTTNPNEGKMFNVVRTLYWV